jgi:hypothetical protein
MPAALPEPQSTAMDRVVKVTEKAESIVSGGTYIAFFLVHIFNQGLKK